MKESQTIPTLSVVLPCLNEERTLAACIGEVRHYAEMSKLSVEIVVADNGSSDRSIEISRKLATHTVTVVERGYGAALDAGIRFASSEYILIADSDLSYDFSKMLSFYSKLHDEEYDLVLGNRFKGSIEPGAMPWHHRYIGNPVLSGIGRILFTSSVNDFHCGIRAFRKTSYLASEIRSKGMEFASDMIIQFANRGLRITEVPVTLRRDGRDRKPHIRSFRDGWRHLKLMLSLAPQFTLLLPGLFMSSLGGFFSLLAILPIYKDASFFHSEKVVPSLMLPIGSMLITLGATSIAHRKTMGAGHFKWLPIRHSGFREAISIAFPIALMIVGIVPLFFSVSLASVIVSYSLTSSGLILFAGALVVRQILSPYWSKVP